MTSQSDFVSGELFDVDVLDPVGEVPPPSERDLETVAADARQALGRARWSEPGEIVESMEKALVLCETEMDLAVLREKGYALRRFFGDQGLRELQVRMGVLIARAERRLLKMNPPMDAAEAGRKGAATRRHRAETKGVRRADTLDAALDARYGEEPSPIPGLSRSGLRSLRHAHAGIGDDLFDAAMEESVETTTVLTQKNLTGLATRAAAKRPDLEPPAKPQRRTAPPRKREEVRAKKPHPDDLPTRHRVYPDVDSSLLTGATREELAFVDEVVEEIRGLLAQREAAGKTDRRVVLRVLVEGLNPRAAQRKYQSDHWETLGEGE